MQEPRVVFQVINSLGTGGAESFVVNLLRYLNREKYQPVCVCLSGPKHTHNEALVEGLGVPLYYLRGSNLTLAWLHNRMFNALFKQFRPQIVHTHLSGIRYALPLAIKHRTPVRVHTLHNLAEKEIGERANRLVRILAFRYRIGGFIPVAIAQEVARTVEAVYGYKNPPVILNGIPVEEYTPNPSQRMELRCECGVEPNATVIVHIGRFMEQKNHPLLLQAFSRLRRDQPVYLWLVGGGELLEPMQQLARELGIAERVRFWGVRSDVPALLSAADIFTLPSRYEGNPLSVMEAMAAGLPVVATAVGGVPELVEEGVSGFLTPNEDVEALTAALQRLVDNVELRRQMGEAALKRVREKFDIRHTVRAYEALYEEILQRRRRSLRSQNVA
ncbi:MAG: glycosyltransferase [Fimbriimonadales bacterium]|nr:glycosyltransferase [Fimbriimonadales bacterium]